MWLKHGSYECAEHMKLYIKNMVSLRCKLFVAEELHTLGVSYLSIDMGVVELNQRVTPEQLGLSGIAKTMKSPGSKELVMVKKPFISINGGAVNAEMRGMKYSACALCDLAPRQPGMIAYAPELPSLAALGVRTGKTCRLVAAQPWGGPIVCSVGGRQIALERAIAERIGVTPVGEE